MDKIKKSEKENKEKLKDKVLGDITIFKIIVYIMLLILIIWPIATTVSYF